MADLSEQPPASLTGSDLRARTFRVATGGAHIPSFGNGAPSSGRNLKDELERLPVAVDLVVNLDGLRVEDASEVAAALKKSDRLQAARRIIVVSEHHAIRRALEHSELDRKVLIEHSLDDAFRYVLGHELLEELAAGTQQERSPTPSRAAATPASPLSPLRLVNLVLRVVMETGIVAALGYWGIQSGTSPGAKIALGLGAPVLGFGFWGAVDFHRVGRLAEPLRLLQELVISGLAAVALYTTGQHALGWALALLSVAHHGLVYLLGGRLLERDRDPGSNAVASRLSSRDGRTRGDV